MSFNPLLPKGQATMAESAPVVIASNQSAVPTSVASLPLPALAATSTKQSDGTQKTQIVDGSGNVIGATSNAIDVNVKSGSITASENLAQVNGQAVNVGTGAAGTGTQRVSVSSDSSITANAGTNLNTSTLAVESGGHLASLDTKLPAQGQALAAASVPVVLTAAQVITLTPPAAITGFATSTKQSDGSQVTQIVDVSGNAVTVTGNKLDVNATVNMGANATVDLNKVSGSAVATAGAGIQMIGVSDGAGNGITSTGNALNVNISSGGMWVGATINDGSDAAEGSTIDTVVAAGATGTVSAKLRRLTTDLDALKTANHTDLTAATPAGTNLIGKISASNETSTIYNGTTALTPVFVAISASSNGNNTLVAADATHKIRVLSLWLIADAAVVGTFQSAAGGTALSGAFSLAANGGFVLPLNNLGWFETTANQLLNLSLSGAIGVRGSLSYVLI